MEDIISSLSDEILQQILCFMHTRDAIRTSVLSKRWKDIWKGVPKIVFEPFDHRITLDESLSDAYEKTLSLHVSPKIKTFVVSCNFEPRDNGPRIDQWIKFAVDHRVEDLSLSLSFFVLDGISQPIPEFYHRLPEFLYNNKTLVTLKLDLVRCNLTPRNNISWPSLKSLTLAFCTLSDELMVNILSGCPLLENLALEFCKNVSRIDIKSRVLKRLEICGMRDHPSGRTEIRAPNISSLILREHSNHKYRIVDVSFASEADISFSVSDRLPDFSAKRIINESVDTLLNILPKLQHVENLSLGTWTLQILSVAELKGLAYPFLKCKHVAFHGMIDKFTLPGIARLLQRSPELKTLIINLESTGHFPACHLEDYIPNLEEDYLRSGNRVFLCLLHSLKTVKITEAKTEQNYGSRHELLVSVLEFLLSSGRVLEKMIIQVKPHPHDSELNELIKIRENLSHCPKASKDVAVCLQKLVTTV
ncbi:PREDICTED: F-box protein At5g03100-like [Tarenaya hassleriana]|uniref:F-box protein At5g03100-like n=1 Tax=Tarenaya hassleriana TaxID=28532 RepID=UPI00053C2095|nr:PREDICTED: F-box protein At5g03100-like [Tarenaya hassleriana]